MTLSVKRPMPAVGASFPQPFMPKVGDPCHRRGWGDFFLQFSTQDGRILPTVKSAR